MRGMDKWAFKIIKTKERKDEMIRKKNEEKK
jgi:hypothetical protein